MKKVSRSKEKHSKEESERQMYTLLVKMFSLVELPRHVMSNTITFFIHALLSAGDIPLWLVLLMIRQHDIKAVVAWQTKKIQLYTDYSQSLFHFWPQGK